MKAFAKSVIQWPVVIALLAASTALLRELREWSGLPRRKRGHIDDYDPDEETTEVDVGPPKELA